MHFITESNIKAIKNSITPTKTREHWSHLLSQSLKNTQEINLKLEFSCLCGVMLFLRLVRALEHYSERMKLDSGLYTPSRTK